MKYLLFLNKFDLNKDRLRDKIKTLDSSANFENEENILVVDTKLNADKFVQFQEVNKIAIIFNDWKEFGFKDLKGGCLKLCKGKNIKNYFIKTKFYDKAPISAKSLYKHINPYLKHEGILVDEVNGDIVYLEFKKINGKLNYRLCFSKQELWNKVNALEFDLGNFYVVIEEPRLVEEISDFLRLCWIFKLPLFILTKDQRAVENIVERAKKITKGIDYNNFTLKYIPHLSKDFIKVGFSKHSVSNEKDLFEFFKNNDDERICLVFGNDTYGLSQEVRDDLDYCFRLTPEIKKPLRASQALSYVLGIFRAYKL